jgi:nucleotide-binding universal stress UspA family protein
MSTGLTFGTISALFGLNHQIITQAQYAVLEDGQERYEKCFVSLREHARQKDIERETDVVLGHPAEQIIHKADTIQPSLIVMGKRSHTILHRWMLGSNSERALRYSQCPVMIVH